MMKAVSLNVLLLFGFCHLAVSQTIPDWFPKPPPPLAPSGEAIRVSTVEELLAAVERVPAGGTILLADGRYSLPRPVVLDQKQNVVLRSASGDAAGVTLTGKGWEHGDSHDDILHISRCDGVTIADLTFADCRSYGIKVEAEHAPKNIQILNCCFRDIGVRAIKGSAAQDSDLRARKGTVRGCYFENTRVPPADWLFGGDYISAIDMMALEDWTFSDNVFRNIKGRNGGARAAIFIWVRSCKIVVERNLVMGCDRGVAFGNPGKSTANLAGEKLVYVADGIIRNNFIVGGPDCGIELWYTDGIKVLNNSIWRPERNWNRGIRIGTGTTNAEIANNLVHGGIQSEGGEAQIHHNLAGHLDGYFADPASGDLRLTSSATGALKEGVPLVQVTEDIRRLPRKGNPDLGAWQTSSQTVLGIQETRFALNGQPTFLLGISYYGALGASEEFIRRDLDDLGRYGFNWVRVWATWAAFDSDVSAVGAQGGPREPFLSKLQWLLAECDRRGLVVDVTLTRKQRQTNASGIGGLADFASHERAVETLIKALKPHRNWYLDLANERDVRDARFVSPAELKSLRDLARHLDPELLVTASTGGHDLTESDVRDSLLNAGCDFLSPHRPRDPNSPSQTEARTRACLALAKALNRVVPVQYQEPFRRGYERWEPTSGDFLSDLRGAVAGGAAGWCFHNGSERGASGNQLRRCFDLRAKRLFDQLDPEELKVVSGVRAVLSFQAPRVWEYSAPLIAPENRTDNPSRAQKDPSVVFYEGKWHVFMTVKLPGKSAIEYCSFTSWESANAAPRTILNVSDSDYYCAPQVFYFRPHKKWYLVYQVGVPGKDKMWVAYSTTADISDPQSWTRAAPMLDGGKDDPRQVGGLDYWIICDQKRAYLFLTSLDGRMWRLWTRLEDFPRGFDHCEVALQAKVFEASHTYRLKGKDAYLTIIEENGRRYYKAYLADRLDGEWVPVADSADRPFAGWNNIRPAPRVEPWTDNISHGELIRDGVDETLTVDPSDLRFVFQGMWDKHKSGKEYGQFQWRIGILTPAVSERTSGAAIKDR